MQLKNEFKEEKAWGLLTSIDLFECNPKKIRSKKEIKKYAKKLCELIEMKRFRETTAVRFGQDKKVQGYSMIQLIETSLISGHFAENTNSAYIDIFSCKYYDAQKAEQFTKKFFEAKKTESNLLIRKMPSAFKKEELPNPRNWFFERLEIKQGQSLAVKGKQIYSKKSSFQNIEVYDTKAFGRMLVLDGIIQTTEKDEFTYHEMIVHPAIHVHSNPKKVLIIGGGDGGTAREIEKHPEVKEIHLCDLDKQVIETAKKFLPFTAEGFKNEKLKVFNEDGFKFLKRKKNYYDIIIVDSTDPIGPGKNLFKKNFYELVYASLKSEGIMINQFENFFELKEFVKETSKKIKKVFPILKYYYTLTPSYGGLIGFGFASKKFNPLEFKEKKLKGKLKYYSPAIHKSAFVLPKFAENLVE